MKNKILYFSFFILGAVSCLIANKLISSAQAYYGGCNCSYYDFSSDVENAIDRALSSHSFSHYDIYNFRSEVENIIEDCRANEYGDISC